MENIPNSEDRTLRQNEVLKNILKAKSLRRKELSKISFEKKIEILLQLQKMARGVKKPGGKRDKIIWKI